MIVPLQPLLAVFLGKYSCPTSKVHDHLGNIIGAGGDPPLRFVFLSGPILRN
jgi:hypothetical protein